MEKKALEKENIFSPFEIENINKMNIYEKLHHAIYLFLKKDISAPKKGNVGSGSFAYKAFLAPAIIEAGNKAFDRVRLILVTDTIRPDFHNYEIKTKDEQVKLQCECRLHVKFKLVNIDNKDEFIFVEAIGLGQDSGDKAPNKAMTYAQKYAIMQLLKLQDEFDGDYFSSEEKYSANNISITQVNTLKQKIENKNQKTTFQLVKDRIEEILSKPKSDNTSFNKVAFINIFTKLSEEEKDILRTAVEKLEEHLNIKFD